MEELRARDVRRLRACAQYLGGGCRGDGVDDVLRQVFAIQAQDPAAAHVGVLVRGRALSGSDVREAHARPGRLVRTWLMRGTLHEVAASDAQWLLTRLSPLTLRGAQRRLRELGLTTDHLAAAERLLDAALDDGPITRRQFAARCAEHGLPSTGQAPFHLLRHAALTGLVCFGPDVDGEPAVVRLDDWAPTTDAPKADDEADRLLARRYVEAHGPTTVQDFAHWSGLPKGPARAAWADARASTGIVPVRVEGGDGAVTEHHLGALDADLRPDDVRLLPAYDDYLVAYRDRRLTVPDAHRRAVWPGGGMVRPSVLLDGEVVATWRRSTAGRIETAAFETLDPAVRRHLDAEVAALERAFP